MCSVVVVVVVDDDDDDDDPHLKKGRHALRTFRVSPSNFRCPRVVFWSFEGVNIGKKTSSALQVPNEKKKNTSPSQQNIAQKNGELIFFLGVDGKLEIH